MSGYVEFLSTAGFVAYGRGDGREALSTALEIVPDIVVTDIAMPGLDGFALAAALRADSLTRHVPILGMTAHWTSDTQSNGQRAGFSAMLLKPCLPTHLLAEIERVLQSASQWRPKSDARRPRSNPRFLSGSATRCCDGGESTTRIETLLSRDFSPPHPNTPNAFACS